MEDFNFDHHPGLYRDMIAHLGTGTFLAKARNVVLLGRRARAKPTPDRRIALGKERDQARACTEDPVEGPPPPT